MEELAEKRIAIIGAGMSGLLACKHLMEMGFTPTVFESKDCIGGVWSQTIESTKLQTPKTYYKFTDFDWPDSVKETFPDHNQVLDYFQAYAVRFDIIPRIKFDSKVVTIDYQLCPEEDHMDSWDWWGSTGDAFSAAGKWNVHVQCASDSSSPVQVYQADFVILCIGRYSGLANNPEFPINQGPEVFNGEALHSMDYSNMDDEAAAEFTKNKRVVVVGFQKSAIDIAAEIATRNGPKNPCTLLFRTVHWTVPEFFIEHSLKSFNRFSELMLHKPQEGFFLWLLAFLLSPLLWIQSKVVESYLKWTYPLKKYNMVPNHGFFKQIFSCMFTILPNNFYKRVDDGSLLLMKSKTFSFYKHGLNNLSQEQPPIPAEIVIFATGYKSTEKLKSIFKSSYFQNCIANSTSPFYRESIHPRIPQLAILGYADSASYLYTTEMRSKWVAHLLAGKFKLPAVREMEVEMKEWEKCSRMYAKEDYKSSCASVKLPILFNDLLCRDMGLRSRRKNGIFSELFGPYLPSDYKHMF
ncbi:Probable flavin-containing monooxygenase 1 [Linum grandiflorum]